MSRMVLDGLRILIVEDEMLVALLVEDTLSDEGCVILGPAASVQEAMSLAKSETFDAAVMDVNIAGEKAYPVAEMLDHRNIPFLFVSGYGQSAVPDNRPTWRVCPKPFRSEELVHMLKVQIEAKRV